MCINVQGSYPIKKYVSCVKRIFEIYLVKIFVLPLRLEALVTYHYQINVLITSANLVCKRKLSCLYVKIYQQLTKYFYRDAKTSKIWLPPPFQKYVFVLFLKTYII